MCDIKMFIAKYHIKIKYLTIYQKQVTDACKIESNSFAYNSGYQVFLLIKTW